MSSLQAAGLVPLAGLLVIGEKGADPLKAESAKSDEASQCEGSFVLRDGDPVEVERGSNAGIGSKTGRKSQRLSDGTNTRAPLQSNITLNSEIVMFRLPSPSLFRVSPEEAWSRSDSGGVVLNRFPTPGGAWQFQCLSRQWRASAKAPVRQEV